MKHPKQLKPITSFIFFLCSRNSGNNKSRVARDTQATGKARLICGFATGSSLICALHPHGHKMYLVTLDTGCPGKVSREKTKQTCGEEFR